MILHSQENHRFQIKKPEGLCYLEYAIDGNRCTVLHTVVPDALSGQGLASQLAQAFYDWAHGASYIILSDCSYMTAWMKRKGLSQ